MTPPAGPGRILAARRLAAAFGRREDGPQAAAASASASASASRGHGNAPGFAAGAAAEAAHLASGLPGLLVAAEEVASAVAGGVHGRRRAGQGDSFWEYRPLREGEAANRIDWRRSARSGRAFVRETEWEAAQTVCLWRDASPAMRWRSNPALPRKADRATLLLLALAALLLKGGEHPRLVEASSGLSPSFRGPGALERFAVRLAGGAGDARGGTTGELPGEAEGAFAPHALPARARAVLFGDFLAPVAETGALIASLVAIPVSATLVQVLDPAERALPFRGRVRFRGAGRPGELLAPRAENLRDAYAARLAAHQAELARLCADAGFGFAVHGTDEAPARALLDLALGLAA